jgi:heat shock protein HslJ
MMSNATSLTGCVIAITSLAACACASRPEQNAQTLAAASAADRSAPTLRELKNATYQGVKEAGAAFALANGRWEGNPYEPGGASRPGVTFVRDFRLEGDLDGDGAPEAVVLLAASAAGTGETSYLAIVGRSGGQVANIATAPVGDRVQLRDAKIDGRRIVLDLVQAGGNDAACCPGDLVTRTWELQADALKEGASAKAGRLSIDAIGGTEWVLRGWAWDEPAPPDPEVTLKLDGTRLVGSAGCNTYFAQVQAGDAPGDLEVGPAGATRKMCPERAMSVEARFLQQLSGVTRLRFVAGQLALSYAKADLSSGVMLFERRAVQ